jgi:hypothetical protein
MLEAKGYRLLAFGTIAGTLLILLLLLGVVTRDTGAMVAGPLLYDQNGYGGEPLALAVESAQNFYSAFTALVTTAFGALAFLVTLQQKRRGPRLSRGGAVCLAGALAMLVVALILSLLGSEILMKMLGNNAINLGLQALRLIRWSMYLSFVAAALFMTWFALDTLRPEPDPVAAERKPSPEDNQHAGDEAPRTDPAPRG